MRKTELLCDCSRKENTAVKFYLPRTARDGRNLLRNCVSVVTVVKLFLRHFIRFQIVILIFISEMPLRGNSFVCILSPLSYILFPLFFLLVLDFFHARFNTFVYKGHYAIAFGSRPIFVY